MSTTGRRYRRNGCNISTSRTSNVGAKMDGKKKYKKIGGMKLSLISNFGLINVPLLCSIRDLSCLVGVKPGKAGGRRGQIRASRGGLFHALAFNLQIRRKEKRRGKRGVSVGCCHRKQLNGDEWNKPTVLVIKSGNKTL